VLSVASVFLDCSLGGADPPDAVDWSRHGVVQTSSVKFAGEDDVDAFGLEEILDDEHELYHIITRLSQLSTAIASTAQPSWRSTTFNLSRIKKCIVKLATLRNVPVFFLY